MNHPAALLFQDFLDRAAKRCNNLGGDLSCNETAHLMMEAWVEGYEAGALAERKGHEV
jgi:hypothetical protein